MLACRTEARRFQGLSLALSLFLAGATLGAPAVQARAWTDPEHLLAPTDDTPDQSPAPNLPQIQAGPQSQEPVPQPSASESSEPSQGVPSGTPAPLGSSKGFVVEELAQPSPETSGTLGENSGGFAVSMWQGTPRADVERWMSALPAPNHSPAARSLAHRLLLSSAAVPEGTPSLDLVGLRLAKLLALGDVAGAAALADVTPGLAHNEAAATTAIDALLLTGTPGKACERSASLGLQFSGKPWLKLGIFCRLLASDSNGASVQISLLRDQGDDDEVFYRLTDRLGAGIATPASSDEAQAGANVEPVVGSLPDPSALDLAMALTAQARLPADSAKIGDPARLGLLARNPATEFHTRVEAAERAAALGGIGGEDLAAAYTAVSMGGATKAGALAAANKEVQAHPPTSAHPVDSHVRVLLYQGAGVVDLSGSERGVLLTRALSLLPPALSTGPSLEAWLLQVGTVPPGADVAAFAPVAAGAYLADGKPDDAKTWLDLLRQRGTPGSLAPIWPLAALSGVAVTPDDRTQWASAVLGSKNARLRQAGAFTLALVGAVGEPTAPADGASLPAAAKSSFDAPTAVALDHAAVAKRIGETALLALMALGPDGAQSQDSSAVLAVVTALHRAGLDADARAYAREAVVTALAASQLP